MRMTESRAILSDYYLVGDSTLGNNLSSFRAATVFGSYPLPYLTGSPSVSSYRTLSYSPETGFIFQAYYVSITDMRVRIGRTALRVQDNGIDNNTVTELVFDKAGIRSYNPDSAFSADGKTIAYNSGYTSTGGQPLTLYKYDEISDTWSEHIVSGIPLGAGALAFSPDGAHVAIVISGVSYIVNVDTLAIVSQCAADAYGFTISVSPPHAVSIILTNDLKMVVVSSVGVSPVMDMSSATGIISHPLAGLSATGLGCRGAALDPTGSRVAITGYIDSSFANRVLWVFDLATGDLLSDVRFGSGDVRANFTSLYDVVWIEPHLIAASANATNHPVEIYVFDTELNIFTQGITVDVFSGASGGLTNLHAFKTNPKYKINGTITESLAASTWRVTAFDYLTGLALKSKALSDGQTSFFFGFESNDFINVMVDTYQGDRWKTETVYAPGQLIMTTNPADVPYYFKCLTGGLTGVTEPVWDTTPDGQTLDGQVTWIRVERLIQPVMQGPIMPELVV